MKQTSIFKPVERVLTMNESDVYFGFHENYLTQITIPSNKVLELRENDLLRPSRITEYTAIQLIRDHKKRTIPIVKNTWKYGGRQGGLLSVCVVRQTCITRDQLLTSNRYKRKAMAKHERKSSDRSHSVLRKTL